MKHVKTIVIATVSAIIIAAGASAYAQRGDTEHHNRMIERIGKRLDLDDNQSAALATLAANMEQTREILKGSGTGLRSDIGSLITADTFDQGKALGMINDRAAALQASAPELVAAAAVFFDGLSMEQKSQIQAFADKTGRGHHRH